MTLLTTPKTFFGRQTAVEGRNDKSVEKKRKTAMLLGMVERPWIDLGVPSMLSKSRPRSRFSMAVLRGANSYTFTML